MSETIEHASNRRAPKIKRWRRALLMLGIFFVVCVPLYIEFNLRRPVGAGPAGPSVEAAKLATVWSTADVKLVGIGDSITRGLGADQQSHTFFERLKSNPPDEFDDMVGKSLSAVFPNLRAENFAVSGSTSPDHARVIEDQLKVEDKDCFGIVVMTSGGNDLIHSYGRRPPVEGAMYGATRAQAMPWIADFEQRLVDMIENITKKFPGGCEIFVADIYDPTDGVGDAPSIFLPPWPDGLLIHAEYNEAIQSTASRYAHVHVVPLHETFLGHGSHCRQFWRSSYDFADPHYWFYSNIEDPNDRGYDAIRRVFLNAILEQQPRIAERLGSL